MIARWSCCSCASVVASSRMYSRNSPTVRLWIGAKASRSNVSRIRRLTSSVSGSISGCATISASGQIGELALCGDAFALRARGDARQLVAGLLFVGFGEKLAEIGECEALGHRLDVTERQKGRPRGK